MNSNIDLTTAIVHESLTVQRGLILLAPVITKIASKITTVFSTGSRILLCGNGGSAADAQHVAAELVGRFESERAALPAIALTTNTSILTAVSNDYSFDQIFARQVQAFAAPGDVVAGISTSGNSTNVLCAMNAARKQGCFTIGFTGQSGGKLKDLVDICLLVPSDNTARIQEAHLLVWHIVCKLVEQELIAK